MFIYQSGKVIRTMNIRGKVMRMWQKVSQDCWMTITVRILQLKKMGDIREKERNEKKKF